MALTKVSGDFIQDGSITQSHLHASHGITTSDIGEGSNLYFTTARVDSRIGDLSTSDLSEGTNLYYTDARVGSYLTTNNYLTASSTHTLTNKSGNISQWTNDSGYITDGNTNWDNSYGFITASSTETLTNKSGNISMFTNDSGYITSFDITTQTDPKYLRSNAADSMSAQLTMTGNNLIVFGPNTGWSKELAIGGNANNSTSSRGSIGVTNGNLHIDAANGSYVTYLNFYDGTGGVAFGNGGGSAAVAWMGPDGDLWKGSSDNSGSKYWHAGNDGSGSGLDADLLDGLHASSFLQSETDTLATVTARGASTSTAVTFAKATFNTSSTGLPRQITIKENGDTENSMGSYPGAWTSALNIQSNDGSTYLWFSPLTSFIPRIQTNYGQLDFYTGSNTNRALHLSGTSARSEIFYDSNDTNTYFNSAEIVLRGAAPQIALRDTDQRSVVLHNNSNRFYVLGAPADSTSYAQINGVWPWYVQLDTNNVYTGNIGYAGDSYRAPIFYDSNNTGYNVDPASTSILNRVEIDDDLDVRAQTGTWITADVMSDAIGWNSSYGVYIGSNVGGTHYLRGNGTFTTGGNTYNLWHQGNDGTGSGLDADLVDGYHAAQTYYSTANHPGSYLGGHYSSGGTEKPNSGTFGAGKLKLAMLSSSNLGFGGSWNDVLWMSAYSGGDVKRSVALVSSKYDNTSLWIVKQNFDSSSWGTGYLFWNSGNDGSGSGLDADLLDGNHASAFASSGGSSSTDFNTRAIYPHEWVRINGNSNHGIYWQNGTGAYWHIYPASQNDMRFRTGSSNGGIVGTINNETARGYIHWTTSNEIGFLNSSRSWSLRVDNSGNTFATASHRAPEFYDSNDTGYYINPNSTSNTYAMKAYQYQGNGNVGGTGSASWHPSGIYSAGYNWIYGGINGGNGSATNFSDVRARIFYDYDSTSYYLNPYGTSQLVTTNIDTCNWTYGRTGSSAQSGVGLNFGTNASLYMCQSTYSSGAYYQMINDTGTPLRIRHQVSSFDTTAFTDSIVIFNHNYWRGYVGILRSPEYPLDLNGQARLSGGYTTSDVRLKKNIRDNELGLSHLLQLRTRLFDWITDEEILGRTLAFQNSLLDCRGFIAQEVEEVVPELVDTSEGDQPTKSIDDGAVTAMMVKAIQEQQAIIDDLKARIEILENQ